MQQDREFDSKLDNSFRYPTFVKAHWEVFRTISFRQYSVIQQWMNIDEYKNNPTIRRYLENLCKQTELVSRSLSQAVESVRLECDLFLMSPEDKPKISDKTHLYLYKNKPGEFYYVTNIHSVEATHVLELKDSAIKTALASEKFDQDAKQPNKYGNELIRNAVLAETSSKGHTEQLAEKILLWWRRGLRGSFYNFFNSSFPDFKPLPHVEPDLTLPLREDGIYDMRAFIRNNSDAIYTSLRSALIMIGKWKELVPYNDNECDLFLMPPEDKPQISDTNHLYLYKNEREEFYYRTNIDDVEATHILELKDSAIKTALASEKFDQDVKQPHRCDNELIYKAVFAKTAAKGHTHEYGQVHFTLQQLEAQIPQAIALLSADEVFSDSEEAEKIFQLLLCVEREKFYQFFVDRQTAAQIPLVGKAETVVALDEIERSILARGPVPVLTAIADPMLLIPERELDEALLSFRDPLTFSLMFCPRSCNSRSKNGGNESFIMEGESFQAYVAASEEKKEELVSPTTQLPADKETQAFSRPTADFIRQQVKTKPYLAHHQDLPVNSMKKAIDNKETKKVRILLDLDVCHRYLAVYEIIEKVNQCGCLGIQQAFEDKFKEYSRQQTILLAKAIKANDAKQVNQILTHTKREHLIGWKLLDAGPTAEQKELSSRNKEELQAIKNFLVEHVIVKEKPEIRKILIQFFPLLEGDLFEDYPGYYSPPERIAESEPSHGSWMRIFTSRPYPRKRKELLPASDASTQRPKT